MFRLLRIVVLLFILIGVAASAYNSSRLSDWGSPVWVAVYAINGDGTDPTERYISRLDDASFANIERYIISQARTWNLPLAAPVRVFLAGSLRNQPPQSPQNVNPVNAIFYTLKLRWWAWRHSDSSQLADTDLFVVYHNPASWPVLPHSIGLEKGKIGIIHAYGRNDYQGSNDVVIAHEFLHTLGATDKYDPDSNMPTFPEGFARPDQSPLYPQRRAELMAGRIAIDEKRYAMPRALGNTVIGEFTAREIGWLR